MKIFYDTEFLEGTQDKRFLGIKYGKTKPTINLISIGMIAEDDREYYVISKDFNLKEAWYRWDGEYHEQSTFEKSHGFSPRKKYWIRENVLKPIFEKFINEYYPDSTDNFTYKNLKRLIKKYGKTNKHIAEEIKSFVYETSGIINPNTIYNWEGVKQKFPVEFYGYYSSYDHVVLCWLFGKMIDLPKGFPMYTIDLKQILDEKQNYWISLSENKRESICRKLKLFSTEIDLKKLSDYPKNVNEHNALQDAKWNKQLYEFLQKK